MKFGLIGYPIKHSVSPELFRKAYSGRYQYDLIETEDFEEAFGKFLKEYQAINVTMPFKMLAAQRADFVAPEVVATGAANILVKTEGGGIRAHNSDYLGVHMLLSEITSGAGYTPENAWPPSATLEGGAQPQAGKDERSEHFSGVYPTPEVAVIGFGGAGKAAAAAAKDLGMSVTIYHHDEIADGVSADIIIYCLPKAVEGIDKLSCRYLLEANYKDPVLSDRQDFIYIHGREWHRAQAVTGYKLMTGFDPEL